MFTQTFVHNNEKYAVIEGTMSSIRTLNSKQNQLYIDGRMAVSTKAMNMFMNTHYSVNNGVLWATIRMFGDQAQKFWKKVFLINAELYLPENCRLTKPIMEKCI